FCYILCIRDAYRVGRMWEQGLRPPGVWDTYRAVTDKGYPYLLIAPGLFLLVFVVLFPLLFMVLLAFTNFDLYHWPPAKLVDWVGFYCFVQVFQLEVWRNSFFNVTSWIVVWTLVSSTVQFALGLLLSVLVTLARVEGKKLFRTIFIL